MQANAIAALFAAAVLGCSASAQSEPRVTAPGALRARGLDGTDYGLVYHLERMQVGGAAGGSFAVPTAVLKAPGVAPYLEWRIIRSGEAYPCPSFHELPGCTGAAAMADLAVGFACTGADGHAYVTDVLAAAGPFAFQSVRTVTFDGATFVVSCTEASGTAPRTLPLADVGLSRTIASQLALEPAD